ncbi:hypothetical protein CFC21_042560 [Triticum aestivum]|uniref:Cysteine proteinase inhibitor n=2 Tax=Triticum aestivum TaxID=4565 RepID=A0A3B6FRI9_WHEAT|nr:hypothetical protein CFC21_042560 [Triticum aestivum]
MEMWKYRVVGSVAALLLLLAIVVPFTQTRTQSARDKAAMAEDAGPLVGGIKDSPMGQENDLDVIALARFAVSEHNNKAARPSFARICSYGVDAAINRTWFSVFSCNIKNKSASCKLF